MSAIINKKKNETGIEYLLSVRSNAVDSSEYSKRTNPNQTTGDLMKFTGWVPEGRKLTCRNPRYQRLVFDEVLFVGTVVPEGCDKVEFTKETPWVDRMCLTWETRGITKPHELQKRIDSIIKDHGVQLPERLEVGDERKVVPINCVIQKVTNHTPNRDYVNFVVSQIGQPFGIGLTDSMNYLNINEVGEANMMSNWPQK